MSWQFYALGVVYLCLKSAKRRPSEIRSLAQDHVTNSQRHVLCMSSFSREAEYDQGGGCSARPEANVN